MPLFHCCLTRLSESSSSDRTWVSVTQDFTQLSIEACKQSKHHTYFEICKSNYIHSIRRFIPSHTKYKRSHNSCVRRVFSTVLRRQGHGRCLYIDVTTFGQRGCHVLECFLCMTLAAEYHHSCAESTILQTQHSDVLDSSGSNLYARRRRRDIPSRSHNHTTAR
jgi:hypothetical protein